MGNVVIITGGSSGLGLELGRNVPFSARIVDVSRSAPPSDSNMEHWEYDLTQVRRWEELSRRMARLIDEESPSRAVMIHCAGTISPIGFAGEVDEVSYTSSVILNSAAGQAVGNAFLRSLQGRTGTFDLVLISSGAGSRARPGWSAYGAGKAAADHWVRHVGMEQEIRGAVRVSSIAPGVLDTAMQAAIRATDERDFPGVGRSRAMYDEGDLADPAEAARRLWALIEDGVPTGSVLDLRDL